MLVVHRPIAAGDRLYLVVEVHQDLVQRQLAVEHDAASIERLGVIHLAALFQNELENVPNVLIRTKEISFDNWFADFLDLAGIG